MKKIKRTKKETRINNRKDTAYSSFYSIASFFASLVYLVADIAFDDRISAIIAFAILVITFIVCEVSVKKLRKALDADDKQAKRICETLSDRATLIGYLSYILLALSLLAAMII